MNSPSGRPMSRMMSDKAPVPAAGIVVIKNQNEVLLIRRGKPPYQGEWSIPGGKIEYGETTSEAALRELKEETGIEADLVGLIDVIDSIGLREKGQPGDWHYLLVDYAARWVSGEPVAQDDVDEAVFYPLEEALALTRWDKTRDVIGRAIEMVAALQAPQSVSE